MLKKSTVSNTRRFRKQIGYAIYLGLVVFLALEIALRMYNPFHLRLKGDRLMLPVGKTTTIHNTINPKLDEVIINTRNGLGFRGPEKPADFVHSLSIITVGGSTTECHFLNEQHTWPFLTGQLLQKKFNNLWLNNAGLDGHSTFGHEVLLNDYLVKLKPKVITFLIGINDVENDQPTFHDKLNTKGAYPDFKHFIFENSEVLNLALNLVRGWRAQKMNNTTHKELVLDPHKANLVLPDSAVAKRLRAQLPYLAGYRRRILELIDTCRRYQIEPVFITQANLFGKGIDSATGVNLETLLLMPDLNGRLLWQMLEMYNDTTRSLCAQQSVEVIDLARLMPKNSVYFYDASHFTNAGAQKVADIVSAQLQVILARKFPAYVVPD